MHRGLFKFNTASVAFPGYLKLCLKLDAFIVIPWNGVNIYMMVVARWLKRDNNINAFLQTTKRLNCLWIFVKQKWLLEELISFVTEIVTLFLVSSYSCCVEGIWKLCLLICFTQFPQLFQNFSSLWSMLLHR